MISTACYEGTEQSIASQEDLGRLLATLEARGERILVELFGLATGRSPSASVERAPS